MPINYGFIAGLAVSAFVGFMPASLVAQETDKWQFKLSPYIWFAGLNGEMSGAPDGPTVPVDVSPEDAFNDTEASFMLATSARKGEHGLLLDIIYSDVRSNELLVPANGLSLASTTKTKLYTVVYQRNFIDSEKFDLDLMAGFRVWDVDSRLAFSGGSGLLDGQSVNNSDTWIDPAVGAKARFYLGQGRIFTDWSAGVGGMKTGSEYYYEMAASLGYQWSPVIDTVIGYRMFDVNYQSGDFIYDVRQQGWHIGLNWLL